jgi:sec-independent protein translocase protein TatA
MGLDNPLHIAFLVVILLLVFGARRLPEIGRSLGSGMREFKDSISGESKQPTITQQGAPQPPVVQPQAAEPQATQEQAAEAFGAGPSDRPLSAEPPHRS